MKIKQRYICKLWAAVNQLRKEDIEAEKDTDEEDDAVEMQEDNEDNEEEGSEKQGRGKRKKRSNPAARRRTRVTKGGSDKNDINSLERYEFIEMILAIANEMLHQKRRLGSLAEALRYVVVEKILMNVRKDVDHHFLQNPNAFRFKRFYRKKQIKNL